MKYRRWIDISFIVMIALMVIALASMALASCAAPPDYSTQNFRNSPASENVASYYDDAHGIACYYLKVAPESTFQCFDVRP